MATSWPRCIHLIVLFILLIASIRCSGELSLFVPPMDVDQLEFSFFLSGINFATESFTEPIYWDVRFDLTGFPLPRYSTIYSIISTQCSSGNAFIYFPVTYSRLNATSSSLKLTNITAPSTCSPNFPFALTPMNIGVFYEIEEELDDDDFFSVASHTTAPVSVSSSPKTLPSGFHDLLFNPYSSPLSQTTQSSSKMKPQNYPSPTYAVIDAFVTYSTSPSDVNLQQEQHNIINNNNQKISSAIFSKFNSLFSFVSSSIPTYNSPSLSTTISPPTSHKNIPDVANSLPIDNSTQVVTLNTTLNWPLVDNMAVITTSMFFFSSSTCAFFFKGLPAITFDTLHISWEAAPTPVSFNAAFTECCLIDSNYILGGADDHRYCSRANITSSPGTSSIWPAADRTEFIIPFPFFDQIAAHSTFEISCSVTPRFLSSRNAADAYIYPPVQALVSVQPYLDGVPLPFSQSYLFQTKNDEFLRLMWIFTTSFFIIGLGVYVIIALLGCYTFVKSRQYNYSFRH